MHAVLLAISLLIGILTAPLAHGQCYDAGRLQGQLTAIAQKVNTEQIKALSHLASDLRSRRCADSSYALVLHNLGRALYIAGQYPIAVKQFQESIAINQQPEPGANPTGQIKSYFYLGTIQQLLQDSPGAITYLTACVRLGKSYNTQHQAVGYALKGLSFLYQEAGDYQKALSIAEQGIGYAHQCNDKLLEAQCLGEKARDLMLAGKSPDALPVINNAIQLIQNDTLAAESRILFTILKAQIANATGNPALSLGLYQQVITYYIHTRQDEQAAYGYGSIGHLYMDTYKDYKKAFNYFQLAYKNFSRPYEKARMLNNIGAVYAYTGQWIKALATYQLALQTLPINFRQADIRQNPPVDAMRLSAEKEYLLTLIQDKADAWLDYAKATKNRQRLQHALNTYRVADQMIDVMRWEHSADRSKLYWRERTRNIYERAIETCYQLGDAAQAFQFFEKSRAVMLADKLNELGARQQLTPQQASDEQYFRQAVSRQQEALAKVPASKTAEYQRARTVLEAKQDSLTDFIKQLEKSNRAYYQLKYNNTVLSLSQIQRYLKNQSASLVTYFVGDSALYLVGITGRSAILRKQSIKLYNESLNPFTQLLSRSESMRTRLDVSRFVSLSHRLYQQLLAPLSLPAGRVIVSPDGFFVPFDALSRSPTEPQYAVNDYAFSYTYSASLLVKNDEDQSQAADRQTDDFLGVAPVRFAPSLEQVGLPDSDKALNAIAERFLSPLLLTQQGATRRAFLEKTANAGIILLFTHATADSTDQEPMLYFADSTLKLSDLGDGALPRTQLVVLSACKTGIGANQRGEGVFSLGRGFAVLGVPSVLTTLWSVQNQATYKLTDYFFKHMDDGLPKDIALQQAKQDWLRDASATDRLPNYWAGLIVVGDTAPLQRTHDSLWMVVSGLSALAGLCGWLWYRRMRGAS